MLQPLRTAAIAVFSLISLASVSVCAPNDGQAGATGTAAQSGTTAQPAGTTPKGATGATGTTGAAKGATGATDTTGAKASTSAPVCKSTVSGAIAYLDLKNQKVTLPYGTAFAITGGTADIQLGGRALSTLITPQVVNGDYGSSDGVTGAIVDSPIGGTTWNVNLGKLTPDSSVTINFHFTGPLAPSYVNSVLSQMMADPTFTSATKELATVAHGKSSADQMAAAAVMSQSAASVVTAILKSNGLVPKNPDDLKTALGTAIFNKIEPVYNVNQDIDTLQKPIYHVADTLSLAAADFNKLSAQDLADKFRAKAPDYSKVQADSRDDAQWQVNQFLKDFDEAAGGLTAGLQGALFTGSASLAVGSDQATDVVCDLQKYAGFDVGVLYSFRLSELRSFFLVHIYFGSVSARPGAPPPKHTAGEWLRQRTSLAFGMALSDISGSTNSKISGQNAFVYGLGFRLNKYFRITAGGLMYRTTLPAGAGGATSPANGALRHEIFIGPSIDITGLSALQSIFAKAKSN